MMPSQRRVVVAICLVRICVGVKEGTHKFHIALEFAVSSLWVVLCSVGGHMPNMYTHILRTCYTLIHMYIYTHIHVTSCNYM